MPHDAYHFGPFQLLTTQRLLTEKGKPIQLGSRAFEILALLVGRAGQLVTKEEMIAHVWPNIFVEEANLRVHIAALRRAMGDGQAGRRYLTNTPGRGYTFVAPVSVGASQAPRIVPPIAARQAFGLPASSPRILGRSDVIDVLQVQLQDKKFVTIAGTGGIGKTTVALALADACGPAYTDGVRIVDLSTVVDANLVTSAVASVLEVSLRARAPVTDLVAQFKDKNMLLVLDSCEHVLIAAAEIAEAIFATASGIHVLTTSREPLRARGESVYRLQPLHMPPAGSEPTAAEALTFPAVQLFVDRATENSDTFELTDTDAPVVSEICRRLDGIALAIELAAGRVSTLDLRSLAAQLDNRFAVLTRGRRTALPRHQTLLATLNWSYELLSDVERLVLRRLSIFAGGFTPDLAEAISKDDKVPAVQILEYIADLVAKSLLSADTSGEIVRYKLLETTRAYAFQKLVESGEREAHLRRGAELLCTLFERAEVDLAVLPQRIWMAKYALYLDDIRSSLDWALGPEGDVNLAVQLTVSSAALWQQLSLLDEFCGRVERAVSCVPNGTTGDARRDMRLYGTLAATLPVRGPGKAETEAAYSKALALARQVGDADYELRALRGLWAGHLNNDDLGPDHATGKAYEFSEAASRSANPNDKLIGERMLGFTLHLLGRHNEAHQHIENMLASYLGSKGNLHIVRYQYDQRVAAYTTLAMIDWLQGSHAQALHDAERAVDLAIGSGHPESLCYALAQAACPIAQFNGDIAAAEKFSHTLIEHSRRYNQPIWMRWGYCFQGMLKVAVSDGAAGAETFLTAFSGLPLFAPRMRYSVSLTQLAEAMNGVRRPAEALHMVNKALEDNGGAERWNTAELLRVKGEAILALNADTGVATAEQCFLRALEFSQRQGAVSWELRSLISLAKLRLCSGDVGEVAHQLSAVCKKFDDSGMTADIASARRLLDELNAHTPHEAAR